MQDNLMESTLQPFVQLAQNNLELMRNLPVPEAPSADEPNPFLQGPTSAANLLQTNTFLLLMQGAVKNYTEFMMAVGQNSIAVVGQAQAGLVRDAQARAKEATGARAKHRVVEEV